MAAEEPSLAASLSIPVPLRLTAERVPQPAGGPPPILIGLHGYAMDGPDMMGFLRKLAPESFFLVSLQGPHSTLVPGKENATGREIGYHWGVSQDPAANRATNREALPAAVDWAVAQG